MIIVSLFWLKVTNGWEVGTRLALVMLLLVITIGGLFMLEGKIIRVGNSAAITISKKDLEQNRLKINQRIKYSILKSRRNKILKELFGIAPNTAPFEREEEDREF